jgi:hypothetical protein
VNLKVGYEVFKVCEEYKENFSEQDSGNLRKKETHMQRLPEKNEEGIGVQYIFKEVDEFYRQVVR